MRILPLLIVVTLAGCAEDAHIDETEDPYQVEEVEVAADLGAISGVVVTETIQPVVGAVLSLQDGTSTMSNEQGQFVFEDVRPGMYFVEAEAAGLLPTQTSLEVQAGEVAKPRILMQMDTSPIPYVQTHPFTGRMVVSDYYAVYILSEVIGNNELCTCYFEFEVEPGVQTVVTEAVWESSMPRLAGHELYWDLYESGTPADATWATSPMVWPLGALTQEETVFQVQASSDLQPDVEQDFEGFVSFFYVAAAPEGWSIVEGDT